jgi:hypothetical protein
VQISPGTGADGRDQSEPSGEGIPSLTASLEDRFIIFKETVGPMRRSEPGPDWFNGIEFGGNGQPMKQGKTRWANEPVGGMPRGAVGDPDGMT